MAAAFTVFVHSFLAVVRRMVKFDFFTAGAARFPAPKEDKADNGLFSLLLAAAVVMAGGGAGYYFKIYKPKHQAPDLEDDYCEYEEEAEEPEESEEDDTPPWDEEEPETDIEEKEDTE